MRFYSSQKNGSNLSKEAEKTMQEMNAQVAIPSFYQNELIAVLVLGDQLSFQVYHNDDIEVFRMLGINTGLALKNALFVQELSAVHSDLLASERLAAIGRLATSAKHEISNPLNIIYGCFQQAIMDLNDKDNSFENLIGRIKTCCDNVEQRIGNYFSENMQMRENAPLFKHIVEYMGSKYQSSSEIEVQRRLKEFQQELLDFIRKAKGLPADTDEKSETINEIVHYAETIHKLITKVKDFDRQLKENIEKAFVSAQKISQAVNAIYHLPKELKEEAARIDVGELINSSFDFSGYQSYWENLSDTTIEKDLPEDLPKVKGHFNRLVSVFSNLIINAYQAMTVAKITTKNERLIRITAKISEDLSGNIEISIANKGTNIPENELEKIFKQGYSTKGSLGVGLDICKTQVEVFHDGKIFARNIEGFGPEFVVRLPVWAEQKKSDDS